MKYKKIINKCCSLAIASLCAVMVSCDGGSDSSSNLSGGDGGDDGGDDVVAGMQRITLAGSTDGMQPIDTNSNAEIRIDGRLVSNMVVSSTGIIVVDIPFGSFYEVRFIGPDGVIGYVGQVVCIYGDAPAQVVTTGQTAAIAGVPAYICPLNVGSDGAVQFVDNPTVQQLSGGSGNTCRLSVLSQFSQGSFPGVSDGDVINISSGSIATPSRSFTIDQSALTQEVIDAYSRGTPAGFNLDSQIYITGDPQSVFQVWVFAFDSPISGYWAVAGADASGNTSQPSVAGGSFIIVSDSLSPR